MARTLVLLIAALPVFSPILCRRRKTNFDATDFHALFLFPPFPSSPQRIRPSESKRMAERVKYARRASGRVSSYALDSEADSTAADEAVHAKKRRSTAGKGEQRHAGGSGKSLLTMTPGTAWAGRRKGKRARDEKDASTAGEASDESDSPKKKTKPRKKRAKKSTDNVGQKKKKQRGKQGTLETIQMLPLEMLSEVSRRRPPPS